MNVPQNTSEYNDEMNYMRQGNTFQFEEDPSSKGAQSLALIKHESVLLMIFLTDKSSGYKKKETFFDLYLTLIFNLSDDGGKNSDLR